MPGTETEVLTSVKRQKITTEQEVISVITEEFLCGDDTVEDIVAVIEGDEGDDLWEHPEEHVVFGPATDEEDYLAMKREIDHLEGFEAFEWIKIGSEEDKKSKHISSRWEKGRKADGTWRCRWVLRQFRGKGPKDMSLFSPTPSPAATNLLHLTAVKHGWPIKYI
jgi:hypothetical protein